MNTVAPSTVTNERPTRVLNEAVLMFVKITQVLNKRDDLNDKITRTFFYNSLDEAKAASRNLTTSEDGPVGYLWMTKALDTLNSDGSVDRVNHNYMWTRAKQWQQKDTKAYTISAEDVAKAKSKDATSGTLNTLPETDNNADF